MATSETSLHTEQESLSLWNFSTAGVIAGLVAGVLNNLWIMIYPLATSYKVPGGIDTMSVTIFSFFPMLVAGIVYYLICLSGFKKGTKIYLIAGGIFLLMSFYFPLFPETIGFIFPEGVPKGFAALTIPMHIFAGAMALILIPKFVKANHGK
jgi:phage shock protein PspC (stress-responsive transcriptional regulator)